MQTNNERNPDHGTKPIYQSADQLVSIITTEHGGRGPRPSYRVMIAQLRPKPHTRCQYRGGHVEWLPTIEELQALIAGLREVKPGLNPRIDETPDKS
jgi:hypothetical protein